jgi:hypothetical protein
VPRDFIETDSGACASSRREAVLRINGPQFEARERESD